MSDSASLTGATGGAANSLAQVQALRRVALAVAHPGGPDLFRDLALELAASLEVAIVFVAVFADDSRAVMRTLGACLDGRSLRNFDYPLEGSPCAGVVGRKCQYFAQGMHAQFAHRSIFHAEGMDSFAAFPLNDSTGEPLGLLVAMDRKPIAGGDAQHAEAMLKIIAGRIAGDIERNRTSEALKAVALAVSGSRSASVFDELVRLLATILQVEVAFIAREDAAVPGLLRVQAMYCDGKIIKDTTYPLAGSPCATVLGQQFRAYPSGLRATFPDDANARAQLTEGYAGHPLFAPDGSPLGIVSIASRRPLLHVDYIEAMLKIFAVRAAAELERLHASEALQRSEASYRAIFEASEDAICIHDWDTGAVLDVNRKALEAYGYTREEFRTLTLDDMCSGVEPSTGDNVRKLIQQAKLGRCAPFEWHRRHKDGSLHWDEVRLSAATIDGRPHILGFSREITAQKLALEELKLREQQYAAIFEATHDGLFLWDSNCRIVDANPAGLAMFGYRREEIIGQTYPGTMPEAYVKSRLDLVRRAMAGENVHMETTSLRRDGTFFDAELRVMPFVQRGHNHALAVVRDVSERRRRERELQRSEARLRATVEAAFDCIVGMDSEGRIVEFNAAAERVFGYRRQDVLGRPLEEVILPERYRAAHVHGVKHFRAQGGGGPMVGRLVETTALRADGTEIPVELAISVAAVPEGSIFVGHLRDISARRAAEAERSTLEAQLRQAQKMQAIGHLTGGLAHDFNNILTSVIGYVAMAQERAPAMDDATLARQLGQARLAAERARDHVAQLLAFSRPQRGERRLITLARAARQALQLLRPTLPSSIRVEFDDPGDSTGAFPPVIADAVQLEQILFNLCINARDAITNHGTIRVRTGSSSELGGHCTSCSARTDGQHWVWVEVADDGCGMAPEVLERMFEPFFTTKAVGHGTGMGLAMVHGIVHDHGGHIEVMSAPGRGSTFRVLLPAASEADRPEFLATHTGRVRMNTSPALRGRVLLVEDEPMVCEYVVELLSGWGLDVMPERDPIMAAGRLAGGEAFDLLLTDQTMPGMTGLALARQVKAQRPGLPVILYTGNASEIAMDELDRCGVHALLRKPIDASALRSLVSDVLAARTSAH